MQKPTIIAREEFSQNLISVINNSELPLFIVRDILNLVLADITDKCKAEYEQAKTEYEKALSEENQNDGSKIGLINTLKKLEEKETENGT